MAYNSSVSTTAPFESVIDPRKNKFYARRRGAHVDKDGQELLTSNYIRGLENRRRIYIVLNPRLSY